MTTKTKKAALKPVPANDAVAVPPALSSLPVAGQEGKVCSYTEGKLIQMKSVILGGKEPTLEWIPNGEIPVPGRCGLMTYSYFEHLAGQVGNENATAAAAENLLLNLYKEAGKGNAGAVNLLYQLTANAAGMVENLISEQPELMKAASRRMDAVPVLLAPNLGKGPGDYMEGLLGKLDLGADGMFSKKNFESKNTAVKKGGRWTAIFCYLMRVIHEVRCDQLDPEESPEWVKEALALPDCKPRTAAKSKAWFEVAMNVLTWALQESEEVPEWYSKAVKEGRDKRAPERWKHGTDAAAFRDVFRPQWKTRFVNDE